MCTLSWIRGAEDGVYEIHFNRDERRTRLPASVPRECEVDGVRLLAPQDGDAGGSWIAVNEHGVTVCLLNRHHEEEAYVPSDPVSRGRLVLECASADSVLGVRERVTGAEMSCYRPFDLAAFAVTSEPLLHTWNGERLEVRPLTSGDRPLASSGLDPIGVARTRRALFELALRQSPENSETFTRLHASHQPDRGSYSVCMHRDDAQTVSYSRIRVGQGMARFAYADGPPCEVSLGVELDIPLV